MTLSKALRRIRSTTLSKAAAALATLGFVLAAASAQADSEFERGFENQLGRLLAFETVRAGKIVLGYGLHGAPVYGHHRPGWRHGHHRARHAARSRHHGAHRPTPCGVVHGDHFVVERPRHRRDRGHHERHGRHRF